MKGGVCLQAANSCSIKTTEDIEDKVPSMTVPLAEFQCACLCNQKERTQVVASSLRQYVPCLNLCFYIKHHPIQDFGVFPLRCDQ